MPVLAQVVDEDLSLFRPKYPEYIIDSLPKDSIAPDSIAYHPDTTFYPYPEYDVTEFIRVKIDSIHQFNQGIAIAEGYRIMIYHGSSSNESLMACNKINSYWPSLKAYPEWKVSFQVKAGDFLDKVEAYHVLSELQKEFPKAILVPDIINIRPLEIRNRDTSQVFSE
jgi:hypothetical protein